MRAVVRPPPPLKKNRLLFAWPPKPPPAGGRPFGWSPSKPYLQPSATPSVCAQPATLPLPGLDDSSVRSVDAARVCAQRKHGPVEELALFRVGDDPVRLPDLFELALGLLQAVRVLESDSRGKRPHRPRFDCEFERDGVRACGEPIAPCQGATAPPASCTPSSAPRRSPWIPRRALRTGTGAPPPPPPPVQRLTAAPAATGPG